MLVGIMGAGRGICNFIGIHFGMMTVRYMEGRMYDWTGQAKRNGEGASRSDQAIPRGVHAKTWICTHGARLRARCASYSALVIILCLVFELNAFFLKYVLWIPPPHVLNHIRLALWFGMANVATREYYVFITSRQGMH